MFAVYAAAPDRDDPRAALCLGERPAPEVPAGWVRVAPRSASLNMHDVLLLRGLASEPPAYPAVLGCDGAGHLADGTRVVIHSNVNAPGWVGPEQLDPGRGLVSERCPGTFADAVAVPARNALPLPPEISFADASCLSAAWLTAYRMLFVAAGLRAGDRVLVDGGDRFGSIAAAAVTLANAAAMEVHVVTATGDRDRVVAPGRVTVHQEAAALPSGFDAVLDAGTGEYGWTRRLPCLRPGARVVCAGGRTGTVPTVPPAVLDLLIRRELVLRGSAMGTTDDLRGLLRLLVATGVRPTIDRELPLARARDAVTAMLDGTARGKIVLSW